MKEKTSQNKIQKNSEEIQTKIQKRKQKNSETNSDDNLEAQNKNSDENSEAHFENSEKTQRKIQDEFQSVSERFLQRFLNVAFPFCRCGVELVSRWELDVERREWNENFNLHDDMMKQIAKHLAASWRTCAKFRIILPNVPILLETLFPNAHAACNSCFCSFEMLHYLLVEIFANGWPKGKKIFRIELLGFVLCDKTQQT